MNSFPDHFSPVASTYARHRPTYPPELFRWIAATARARDVAWDCAAGSGQATHALGELFDRVIATDASAGQIAEAPPHHRVTWRVATAEASGLVSASVDVVTVAQALHWFDLERFWPEVQRVVRPGGLVAAWTYGNHETGVVELDQVMQRFSSDTVGPYWPPNREHVLARYATLSFPFDRIDVPSFKLITSWTLDQVLGYMRSWSATVGFMAAQGIDPVDAVEKQLRPIWGDGRRTVRWPLTVLAGKTPG